MMAKVNGMADQYTGTVRIGLAPLIGSTIFNRAIMAFIKANPHIELKLVEKGTYELQKMLLLQQIDLAVIISPVTLEGIYEQKIYQDTVRAWFNKQHRFNQLSGAIPFSEIEKEKIVTFTNDYMVTLQLNQRFRHDCVYPDYFLQTSSWDLILI